LTNCLGLVPRSRRACVCVKRTNMIVVVDSRSTDFHFPIAAQTVLLCVYCDCRKTSIFRIHGWSSRMPVRTCGNEGSAIPGKLGRWIRPTRGDVQPKQTFGTCISVALCLTLSLEQAVHSTCCFAIAASHGELTAKPQRHTQYTVHSTQPKDVALSELLAFLAHRL